MSPLALLLAVAPAHVIVAHTQPGPVYREFGGWFVACSNVRNCEARGFFSDGEEHEEVGADGQLRIEQAAGPTAEPRISLEFPADGESPLIGLRLELVRDLRPGSGFQLKSADWETKLKQPAAQSHYEDYIAVQSRHGRAARRFLRAVRAAETVNLRNGKGAALATFGLSGLSASLLLIDEVQGRLGTKTALIRTGSKPASSVPAPQPFPVVHVARPAGEPVTKADAEQWLQAVRALDRECDRGHREHPDYNWVDYVGALNKREAIVLLECDYGPYNASYAGYRVQRVGPAKPAPLELPFIAGFQYGAADTGNDLGDADYDGKTQTLHHSYKGRGRGDCGDHASWVFDGQDFQLTSYKSQSKCGGLLRGDWPTLWEVHVKLAMR